MIAVQTLNTNTEPQNNSIINNTTVNATLENNGGTANQVQTTTKTGHVDTDKSDPVDNNNQYEENEYLYICEMCGEGNNDGLNYVDGMYVCDNCFSKISDKATYGQDYVDEMYD